MALVRPAGTEELRLLRRKARLIDRFTITDSSGSVALLRDALGSTIGLVNGAGSLATQYGYEPFGKTITTGSSTTNPYAFAGRELDASGLYFMRARYYNPLLSRFISADPLGLGGGQVNFFAYAYNSPMNFIDPTGLSGSPTSDSKPSGAPGPCAFGDCKRAFGGYYMKVQGSPTQLALKQPPLTAAQMIAKDNLERAKKALLREYENYFNRELKGSEEPTPAPTSTGLPPPPAPNPAEPPSTPYAPTMPTPGSMP